MAVLSIGLKLSLKELEAFTELTNLQEVPSLGGEVEAVEVTVMSDKAHMYDDGLLNYGEAFEFKFLYEKEQFTKLNTLKGVQEFQVEMADNSIIGITGKASVKLDEVGIGAPHTYTLSIRPSKELTFK